ncbi:Crp/Fnr family transcriptional regulator [Macrococcus capreoli]|uniref:Crp/Fnr family transcriptional regulator n=1 Tax=Macrococcus capreoli TaxID=2982690 RepID=UPI0021D56B2F|nr:Crp/Fnr family transcriptional regulator [Macrococcus sp. TMW 2.2395]MCU7556414.1 Crp/Fnr family transcriptional regulator [Macrococcus sp. TMW 2.2395]
MVQAEYHEASSIINYITEEGKLETFDQHQYIYQAEDLANAIYIIKSGNVVIHRVLEDGKEFSLKLLGPRNIFGATTLFCGTRKHSLFAKAKTKVSVYKLDIEQFENAILNDDVLNYEWLLWIQNENEKQEYKLRDLYTIGKKGAVYSTLIRLSNSYGVKTEDGIQLTIDMTNNELANFGGTTREGVNRIISELKANDIIATKGKRITIKDIDYLKQQINCDSCPVNICKIE